MIDYTKTLKFLFVQYLTYKIWKPKQYEKMQNKWNQTDFD